MEKQFDIFISYRREDGDEFAQGFANLLISKGFRVFFDKATLPLGRDFESKIREIISQASDFICVVTESYFGKIFEEMKGEALDRYSTLEKDMVFVELEAALKNDVLKVFPILKNCDVPNKDKLPKELKKVAEKTFVSYDHTFDTYETVFKRIENDLSTRSKDNAFIGVLTDALQRVDISDHEKFNLSCKAIIDLVNNAQEEKALRSILVRKKDEEYYYSTDYRFTVFYTLFSYYRRSHMMRKLLELIDDYGALFKKYDFYYYVRVEELHIKAELSKDKNEIQNYLSAALDFAKLAKDKIPENMGIIHAFCLSVVKLREQDFPVLQKDILEAKKCLDFLIRKNPDYGKYYATRAQFYAVQGKYESALADIKNAQFFETPSHEDWILRIAEYQKLELLMRIKMGESSTST